MPSSSHYSGQLQQKPLEIENRVELFDSFSADLLKSITYRCWFFLKFLSTFTFYYYFFSTFFLIEKLASAILFFSCRWHPRTLCHNKCAHVCPAVQNLGRPYWLTLSPMYLWMLVFFTRPHKEERFLFPIYPLVCLSGAVALSSLQVCPPKVAAEVCFPADS